MPRIQRMAFGADEPHQPCAHGAGQGMIGEGRDQNAGDDRPGRAESRDQQQRQQLCLVADLGERDHARGDE